MSFFKSYPIYHILNCVQLLPTVICIHNNSLLPSLFDLTHLLFQFLGRWYFYLLLLLILFHRGKCIILFFDLFFWFLCLEYWFHRFMIALKSHLLVIVYLCNCLPPWPLFLNVSIILLQEGNSVYDLLSDLAHLRSCLSWVVVSLFSLFSSTNQACPIHRQTRHFLWWRVMACTSYRLNP